MKNIKYRLANEKDAIEIAEIEMSSFKYPWSKEGILNHISKSDTCLFFIMENLDNNQNEIVGYVSTHFFFEDVNIDNIAIKSKYRNKGFSKELLNAFIDYMKSLGGERFVLEVKERNKVAISLYEKIGFKMLNKRAIGYNDEAVFMMELE